MGRPTNIVVERLQACNCDNVSNYRASNGVAQLVKALMSADSQTGRGVRVCVRARAYYARVSVTLR